MIRNFLSLKKGLASMLIISTTLTMAQNNPLLEKWTGPYNGIPPFDKIQVAHFKPALEAAMEENLKEIEMIASNPEVPSFSNTIEALERSGKTFARVSTVYGIWSGNMSTAELQVVQKEMAPRL